MSVTERRRWSAAMSIALAAHVAFGALTLAWVNSSEPPTPEPVVLVELPPEAAPAPVETSEQPVEQPRPEVVRQPMPRPPIEVPPVRAPLPTEAVTLPPPAPSVRSAEPAPPVAAAPVVNPTTVSRAGEGPGTSISPGTNAKARKQEADYFALVSAHLNKRKTYPVEARKARQQGIVTVRFTVDRGGNVSGATIKRSSGHALLDEATLSLLQRVAPLPRMPASMARERVTLSLPIDYSLRTS